MAKSKNGGTRSYLRGRIANDVYSIGKDSAGKKQQIVRSLAEQVTNPRTTAQMRGRMIMSTVMQAMSQLSALVDHSFDGFAAGQPSLSEFIRKNYDAVKVDVAAHPAGGNSFGLNLYGEKGAKGGKYIIASGLAVLPSTITADTADVKALSVNMSVAAPTIAQVKSALGFGAEDFVTKVVILADGRAIYFRVSLKSGLTETDVVTAENVADLFEVTGNVAVSAAFSASGSTSQIVFTPADAADAVAHGIIISVKSGANFIHNNAVMAVVGEPTATADVALPTYPVGSERFLNGGEIAGLVDSTSASTPSDGGGDQGGGGAPNDDDNPD